MVRKLRTAVLVVHGMGSQRPLETVRGVINAVWFDDDDHTQEKEKKLWSHPEPSGVDLDLTVMTTSEIPNTSDKRVVDFHELYWAHLMSETKPVAVLLWLFELARRGPHLKTAMNGLWWCGAVFLCLLLLSAWLLAFQFVTRFANIVLEPYGTPLVAFVMVLAGMLYAKYEVKRQGWNRLLDNLRRYTRRMWKAATIVAVIVAVLLFWKLPALAIAAFLSNALLVPVIAAVSAVALMGKEWGWKTMRCAIKASAIFFGIYIGIVVGIYAYGYLFDGRTVVGILGCHVTYETLGKIFCEARLPWSLTSDWSSVAAWIIIGVYLAINAAFLQPYLGDAARYFRNSPANVAVRRQIRKEAVKTLDQLHRSRDYDRIIVVAHSLGTVVAYDMLRAYYSRICDQIPIDKYAKDEQFIAVDKDPLNYPSMWAQGRQLLGRLAADSKLLAPEARQGQYKPAEGSDVDTWLVTDFVTMGSPLTHAHYFMANGKDGAALQSNFESSIREREYPTCPPQELDGDGRIAFDDKAMGKLRLHHGGTFGMTRWTNLYFEMKEIFWGDAIGGKVSGVFGAGVKDVQVWTDSAHNDGFFQHVSYWKTNCTEQRQAPHIAALIDAIDLLDKDKVPEPGGVVRPSSPKKN